MMYRVKPFTIELMVNEDDYPECKSILRISHSTGLEVDLPDGALMYEFLNWIAQPYRFQLYEGYRVVVGLDLDWLVNFLGPVGVEIEKYFSET